MVVKEDTFQQAIKEIKDGISKQTNQSMARFKLMREMAQNGKSFNEWWPIGKEQADRCVWKV